MCNMGTHTIMYAYPVLISVHFAIWATWPSKRGSKKNSTSRLPHHQSTPGYGHGTVHEETRGPNVTLAAAYNPSIVVKLIGIDFALSTQWCSA